METAITPRVRAIMGSVRVNVEFILIFMIF